MLKELISEKLPRLSSHLDQSEVDLSLFTFNWFLTIYVDNIPVETYLRIWDTFLYEGNKVQGIAYFLLCVHNILMWIKILLLHILWY